MFYVVPCAGKPRLFGGEGGKHDGPGRLQGTGEGPCQLEHDGHAARIVVCAKVNLAAVALQYLRPAGAEMIVVGTDHDRLLRPVRARAGDDAEDVADRYLGTVSAGHRECLEVAAVIAGWLEARLAELRRNVVRGRIEVPAADAAAPCRVARQRRDVGLHSRCVEHRRQRCERRALVEPGQVLRCVDKIGYQWRACGRPLALDHVGRLVALEGEVGVLAVVGQLAGQPCHGRLVVYRDPRHRKVGISRVAQGDDKAAARRVAGFGAETDRIVADFGVVEAQPLFDGIPPAVGPPQHPDAAVGG